MNDSRHTLSAALRVIRNLDDRRPQIEREIQMLERLNDRLTKQLTAIIEVVIKMDDCEIKRQINGILEVK